MLSTSLKSCLHCLKVAEVDLQIDIKLPQSCMTPQRLFNRLSLGVKILPFSKENLFHNFESIFIKPLFQQHLCPSFPDGESVFHHPKRHLSCFIHHLVAFLDKSLFLQKQRILYPQLGQFSLGQLRVYSLYCSLDSFISKINVSCLLVQFYKAEPALNLVRVFLDCNVEQQIRLSFQQFF